MPWLLDLIERLLDRGTVKSVITPVPPKADPVEPPKMQNIHPNRQAFLDMIAWSEGTSTSKWTKNNGYDIIVDGINSPHIFTDYKDHPNVLVKVNNKGLYSTAAGRYQQIYSYWPFYKKLLQLPDFSPASQDLLAIQLIRERKALDDIDSGNVEAAITKCRKTWASLPGAGYGQKEHDVDLLVGRYLNFGGKVA